MNLPARSVVIDKLTKFTGETHEQLTPAQFTQLTGRRAAGTRRDRACDRSMVTVRPLRTGRGLAGSKSFRLRSAFRPTYNMATNLLQRLDAEAARALLARSFAQYQADTGVARLEQRLARERDRERDLAATVAELPPLDEAQVDSPDAISDAVSRLRPGDLVVDDDGLRLAVLGVSWRKGAELGSASSTRAAARSDGGSRSWTSPRTRSAGSICRSPWLPSGSTIDKMSPAGSVGPAPDTPHGPAGDERCDDPRIALERTRNEITQLERRARRDQASIARRFDAVTDVLRTRGHLDGWTVTESGLTLAGIYHEADLLVTEALTDGLFDGLTAPELVPVASCFTYEHRSPTPPPDPWFPSPTAMQRFRQLEVLSQSINAAERRGGVDEIDHPTGVRSRGHSWAAGSRSACCSVATTR